MNHSFLGLPPAEQLQAYEIWDSYFLPAGVDAAGLNKDIERTLPTIAKGAIQRLCIFLNVGLGTTNAATEARIKRNPESVLEPLKRYPQLIGFMQLNANDVPGSLRALDRWMKNGPLVGVYFPGGGAAALSCNHRNFDPLVERIAELGGVIMQHTWFKTGGKGSPGESTPSELVQLAARFPRVPFLCAHAGGEWEKGIRAVRSSPNILVETSGFDSTAGFIEMAVRDLDADRVVFGSHLPSRSLGTELAKIIGANISEADKKKILGTNLRKLLARKSPFAPRK